MKFIFLALILGVFSLPPDQSAAHHELVEPAEAEFILLPHFEPGELSAIEVPLFEVYKEPVSAGDAPEADIESFDLLDFPELILDKPDDNPGKTGNDGDFAPVLAIAPSGVSHPPNWVWV